MCLIQILYEPRPIEQKRNGYCRSFVKNRAPLWFNLNSCILNYRIRFQLCERLGLSPCLLRAHAIKLNLKVFPYGQSRRIRKPNVFLKRLKNCLAFGMANGLAWSDKDFRFHISAHIITDHAKRKQPAIIFSSFYSNILWNIGIRKLLQLTFPQKRQYF